MVDNSIDIKLVELYKISDNPCYISKKDELYIVFIHNTMDLYLLNIDIFGRITEFEFESKSVIDIVYIFIYIYRSTICSL